jgi:nitrogen fixation NifU-like protein
MDLYAEDILDHYRNPRHHGHLEHPTLAYHDTNPFCGDEITIELRIEDDRVADVAFSGKGCAISQASASMLTEEIVGKSLEELKGWNKDSVLEMVGIPLGPVRVKCALLPLKVLKAAVWGLTDEDET